MHDGQGGMHRRNEVLVHLGRDVLPLHRHGKAAVVFARRLVENVLFDVAVVGLRDRVDESDIRAVVVLEPLRALLPRPRTEHHAVHAVAHLHFFAAESALGQVEVGVVEHGEHRLESAQHVGREREQLFLSAPQNVRLGTADLVERIVVIRKVGIGDERAQFFVVERSEFGFHERHLRHHLGDETAHHRRVRCIFGNADVLIVAHGRIEIQFFQAAGKGVPQGKEGEQVLFIAQLSLIGRNAAVCEIRFHRLEFLFPRLVGGEDGREIPGILSFHVFSFHRCCHSLCFLLYLIRRRNPAGAFFSF